jgi:DNA-binding winged helix-turn-helix (wHTH) protein
MSKYRFAGGWSFDEASGELHGHGKMTRLEPQPAAVLALLAAHAGTVVTHDEIRRAIWGDKTHVDFRDSVHYCVRQIRVTLGDDARQPSFIETIPRRGYRFKSEAILLPGSTDQAACHSSGEVTPDATARSSFVPRRIAVAALALTLAGAVLLIERQPNNHHQIAVAMLKTVHDLVF